MPKIPSRKEAELRLLRNFAEIFPEAVKLKTDGSSESQHLFKCRDDFFTQIMSISPELNSAEKEIIDACDFYIRAYRSKAPRAVYSDFNKILNGTKSKKGKQKKPGLISVIDTFIENLDHYLKALNTASGVDLASLDHGDSFLPPVKSSVDISREFTRVQNALNGYPLGHEPSMDYLFYNLGVKNNRLKLLAKEFEQQGRTPDKPFHDFIFYLADIFEDAGIELYPGTKKHKERSVFMNIIRFLFKQMPNDVHHLKSDETKKGKDTLTKFIRVTLKKKKEGEAQFKLSSMQSSQIDKLQRIVFDGLKPIFANQEPAPLSLTPSETKFLKRHINLFPKAIHQYINKVGN